MKATVEKGEGWPRSGARDRSKDPRNPRRLDRRKTGRRSCSTRSSTVDTMRRRAHGCCTEVVEKAASAHRRDGARRIGYTAARSGGWSHGCGGGRAEARHAPYGDAWAAAKNAYTGMGTYLWTHILTAAPARHQRPP